MKNINPDNIFYCFKSCSCDLIKQKGKLKKTLNAHEKEEITDIYAKLKSAMIQFNVYDSSKEYINTINKHISIIEAFLNEHLVLQI